MQRLIGAEPVEQLGVFGRQRLTNGSIEFVHRSLSFFATRSSVQPARGGSQLASQQFACVVQPGLDGPRRHMEDCGNVLDAEVLTIEPVDGRAVHRRQRSNRVATSI